MNIEHKNILEALLFAASEPLSVNALHERMPEGADVGALLLALQEEYSDRGVRLVEVERHWAFRTAPDLAEHLEVQKDVHKKLSRAAMEVMAIVAYHQPITRAEIENIRGVKTNSGTLDLLIELGWVKPGRRRETPGRPLTWVSTTEFLDHFSLESIMDLPGLDDLKESGMLDRRPAIEALPDLDEPDPDLFDSGMQDGANDDAPESGTLNGDDDDDLRQAASAARRGSAESMPGD